MERSEVYSLIDGERAYQKQKWSKTETKGQHSITEFIAYIEDYLAEAKHLLARKKNVDAYPLVKPILIQAAAMLVSCMEQHGAAPVWRAVSPAPAQYFTNPLDNQNMSESASAGSERDDSWAV